MHIWIVTRGLNDPPTEEIVGAYACLGSAENRADDERAEYDSNNWSFSNHGRFRIWNNEYSQDYVAIEQHELKN